MNLGAQCSYHSWMKTMKDSCFIAMVNICCKKNHFYSLPSLSSKFGNHSKVLVIASTALCTLFVKESKCKKIAHARSPKDYNFFADVAQDVFPAVVNVRSITEQSFGRSTVTTGSGFIVKSDGLIITSASLIGNHTRFTVRLQDGRDFDGRVVAVEGSTDLGALRINAKDLPTIALNKGNDTRVGEWVMAYGSPLALKHSITAGIVSNAHRVGSEIGVKKGSQGYLRYLQTDAIINNGNSGGPLVNLAGEVIGINTLVASTGIGFAIPVDYVADFVKKINNKEYIGSNRPWLGIRVLSLTHDINQQLRQKIPDHPPKEQGLFIDGVGKNSPASRAGLEYKDIITKVNGYPAKSPKDIHFALSKSKDVLFTVKRKDKHFEVLVKADEIKRSE